MTARAKTPPGRRAAFCIQEFFRALPCLREEQGWRTKQPVSLYRTSNQAYGSRAPTVHEMPKVFYPNSSKFSRQLAAGGMFRNNTFNVYMEKSIVTGPDNYITSYDRFNFHPSYNVSKPSICD
ncbi:UPF0691 protein C9orf116 homolog isoform X2 [Ursus americanus]|uniref:UPF0691 protein C9orf116 homolog isoform X2 n=1 Tax=Ursus maritimus TaxID=29073 RepID=A0A8M1FXL9_URSMA|nr:UPF0691 protein C9orf116 homolog isoform X2 [Ursus maritimus]XP_040488109.1 UPF0691 protein C9orf116 homolog isoform X2 [Ursus maritimus]XP_045669654.1 UPF0691 protein C9orf116 homolog isoform X2 [Ursus americanus]